MFGTSGGQRKGLRLPRALHRPTHVIGAVVAAVVASSVTVARAADATWAGATGDFNTAANWNPNTVVPDGTASFGNTGVTSLSFSTNTTVGGFTFNAGASAFTFSNDKTLTFNGAGIIINGGSATINNNFSPGIAGITFDNSSTAGSATINNTSDLAFQSHSTAGTATISNSTGFGVLFFSNFSSADHATITNGADLTFVDNSTADHATIINNSTLDFQGASTAANASITNNAGADLHFDFNSKAGSANITNNNTLEFGESSSAENATITTTNTGTTFINDSANGGAARFILNGGALDISGVTTGSTFAGSIEGNGKVFLGANTLAVGGNNASTTFSGVIQDLGNKGGIGGSLSKEGTGTLTLTGINTYTGGTTVDAGTLEVDGSIAKSSLTTVNNGATLDGTGTLGATLINGGGTLAPGNAGSPIATLTVNGSLTFQSAAIYMIAINASTNSNTSVVGTATLGGGGVKIASGSTPQVGVTYTILTATAGVSGLFNPTVQFGDLAGTLTYDFNDVFLTFKISSLTALLPRNAPLNAVNVANTIDNFIHAGGTLPAGFQNIFNIPPSQLVNALLQIDGEVGTGAEKAAFRLMDQFLELMLDPFVYGRSGGTGAAAKGFAPEQHASFPPDIALAYGAALRKAPPKPSFDQRWTVWGAGFGGSATAKGNAAVIGSSNITTSDYGFAVGADYHYSPDTVFGFALAGAGTNWGLASNFGTGRSDAFMAGGYAISHFGPAYFAGDVAFGNHWFTTNRTALGDQLTARFNGQSYGARFEAGYRHGVQVNNAIIGVTPYAALQTQWFHSPSHSETDLTGGGFALAYNAMNGNDTRAEIGARFDSLTIVAGLPVQLRARMAWAHDWVTDPELNAVFQTLPGTAFIVNGAPVPNNSALASAGAQFYITPRLSLIAKFDGEFARSGQTYAGTGTLRYMW